MVPPQLTIGAFGEGVRRLQDVLRGAGHTIPASEYERRFYGPETARAVRLHQAEHGPLELAADGPPAPGAAPVPPRARATEPASRGRFVVRGRASLPDSTAIAGASVTVLKKLLRSEVVLSRGTTGPDGGFAVRYDPIPPHERERPSVDLVVRLDGAEPTESPVLFDPDPDVRVYLTPGGHYSGPSRHATLIERLTPALGGVPLAELEETSDRGDLSYLARSIGIDLTELTRLVLAAKLEAKTQVVAAVYYALFEQDLPLELAAALSRAGQTGRALKDASVARVLEGILSLPRASLAAAVASSIRGNVVAGLDEARAVDELVRLKRAKIADESPGSGKTPLRDVVAVAIDRPELRETVIDAIAENGGVGPTVWKTLRADPAVDKETVDRLRFTFDAGETLFHHLPLTRAVNKLRDEGRVRSSRDLARLGRDGWESLLLEHDPTGAEIKSIANLRYDDPKDRLRHFAAVISDRWERRFPTVALAGGLERDTQAPVAAKRDVVKLLDANPSFDLRSGNIDRLLKDRGPAGVRDLEDKPAAVRALKKLQRVFKLAPSYPVAKALLADGIDSAQGVYFMGREQFIARHGGTTLVPRQAAALYDRAEQTYARTLVLLGNFNLGINALTPAAVRARTIHDTTTQTIAEFPNLQSLFGTLDYCRCDHCRSVYGPAAYFVDLLQFLRHRGASPPHGDALRALFARRGDLGMIELSCENTTTPLPYVDLVCEILEDAVAPPPTDRARFRQTRGTPAALRATPAYINSDAYDLLQQAVFPLDMPYDLWADEARAFLKPLGVTWGQVMTLYQQPGTPVPSPDDLTIAAESLRIGAKELSVIIGAPGRPGWELWGLKETGNTLPHPRTPSAVVRGSWLDVMAGVPVFLHRAGISQRELVQLLDTRYLNPDSPQRLRLLIESEGGFASCDTGQMSVHGLRAQDLVRTQAFLRLHRRLGVTIWDMDKILSCPAICASGAIDGSTVSALAAAASIQRRTGLAWDELRGLWSSMDAATYTNYLEDTEPSVPSVYTRRFRDPTVAPRGAFVFPEDPAALAAPLGASSVLTAIGAALGATASDLAAVRRATALEDPPAGPPVRLDLATLSVVYRHVVLARALDRSVGELLLAIELTDADPFLGPQQTLTFVERLDRLRATGFTLYELDFLLRHGSIDESGIALAPQRIITLVEELRTALLKLPTDAEGATASAAIRRRLTSIATFRRAGMTDAALSIIDGTWAGGDAARDTFIETHFAAVLDVAEAKIRLGPLAGSDAAPRFAYVLAALIQYAARSLVKQKLNDDLGLDAALIDLLLTTARRPGVPRPLGAAFEDPRLLERNADNTDFLRAVTPSEFPEIFAVVLLLGKIRVLVARLRLKTDACRWLLDRAAALPWLGLTELPVVPRSEAHLDRFEHLVALLSLRRPPSGDRPSLFVVLDAALDGQPPALVRDRLADAMGWSRADLQLLVGGLGITSTSRYLDVELLRRLDAAMDLARRLGVSPTVCFGLARADSTAAEARSVRQIARAKFDDRQWLTMAESIQDGLRDAKRRAVVSWLLTHPDPARGQFWRDAADLHGHFLIDPEMSHCQLTTRIKQATSSVQLFVQRCLLHLEPKVVADTTQDDEWLQWTWMKNYRVWEAGRKVFLYPENWIEPELRPDKSPFFADLESELLRSDLDRDAAEEAFANYLDQLSDVARLEVVGVYHQDEQDLDDLHVIGRTRTEPHIHYYRKRSGSVWTAWEKIDLDISGDHLMVVIWNRRLHLLWPLFTEKSKPTPTAARKVPTEGGGTAPEPEKYQEIQLAWTEKKRKKWTSKRVDAARLIFPLAASPRDFTFKVYTSGSDLVVEAFFKSAHWGELILTGTQDRSRALQGEVTSTTNPLVTVTYALSSSIFGEAASGIENMPANRKKPRLLAPTGEHWAYQRLHGTGRGALEILEGHPLESRQLLGQISAPALSFTHQEMQFDAHTPFFVEDIKRTFLVSPPVWAPPGSYASAHGVTRRAPDLRRYSGYTPDAADGYRFQLFYHPYATTFLRELNRDGLDALFARDLQLRPHLYRASTTLAFGTDYSPVKRVVKPYPGETVDFAADGPYALYNWELFFHAPLLIAERLRRNRRFEEALRWYHFIFNPTDTTASAVPHKYWVTKPFFEHTRQDYQRQRIEGLMRRVSRGDGALSAQITAWRDDPFSPHKIASLRPVAYQKTVVMKYIDHLIAWADDLFRRDTIESINEATQLYLLAGEILGPRPENVRGIQPPSPKTFNELQPALDAFSNAVVEVENLVAPARMQTGNRTVAKLPRLNTLYFCIPPNDKLLGCWDLVADRLFKIRHCLNIEGVERQLPLWEPPIDPALLVRASAAGVDLSSVLSDINAPEPLYRFPYLLQKANEVVAEVRNLAASLLTALEKKDSEALAAIRAAQEAALLEEVRTVRQQQIRDAEIGLETLDRTRDMVTARRDHYAGLVFMNEWESASMVFANLSLAAQVVSTILDMVAGGASLAPSVTVGGAGFGGSPLATVTYGGENVANAASSWASVSRALGGIFGSTSSILGTAGSHRRRQEEWDFQKLMADKELLQIARQRAAAEVRLSIAERELANHELQLENARSSAELLRSKFTNEDLYAWMSTQISTTYFQSYQLAYDMAKRASRAYAAELGTDEPSFIQFGYWDSLKKGLLAGEKLQLDLRRMESEYIDRNRRELELTKHFSLAFQAPLDLVQLKQTGECFVDIPESAFDQDYPGHYLRRLKTVSVSVPCVVGPYTGVNATLTLLTHSTRKSNLASGNYPRATDASHVPAPDTRFMDGLGGGQAVATSHGQNDSGLFELNFRDERYLPFEGAGAVSRWHLRMPRENNTIDFSTIVDVVMHLRYTARDGGEALRTTANAAVSGKYPQTATRLLSAKRDYSNDWHRFLHPLTGPQSLELVIGARHVPARHQGKPAAITSVVVMVTLTRRAAYSAYQEGTAIDLDLGPPGASRPVTLTADSEVALLPTGPADWSPAASLGTWSMVLDGESVGASALGVAVEGEDPPRYILDRALIDDVMLLVTFKIDAEPGGTP